MVNMGELFAQPRIYNIPMERVPLSQSEAGRFLLEEGDLLFARQSLVLEGAGKCSIFIGDDEPVTFESHVTRVRLDHAKAHPGYYFYYLASHNGRSAIRSIVEQGAGASGIRGSDLARLEVQWRPLPEQRAVAHVLGTLDDKIELNRRMSETLEAMARALFQSWFVDFEPVRAKMEGRWRPGESLPGLPAEHYHLFPDTLFPSALGDIPESWDVRTLGEVVEVVGGTTPSTKVPEYWKDGVHCWATPKDLSTLMTPVLLNTERRITDSGLHQIGSGLQPPGTFLMSSRAPIGYLAISEVPVAVNQGFIAIPPGIVLPNLYLLYWCQSNLGDIINYANGSTFLEISKSNFRQLPALVPSQEIMEVFLTGAKSLHDRIVASERESQSLAAKRDVLLPLLMSGEVRVG